MIHDRSERLPFKNVSYARLLFITTAAPLPQHLKSYVRNCS